MLTPAEGGASTPAQSESATADLLRRALKNHDAIASALRTGIGSKRLHKAIDDMKAVKGAAADLGLYPGPTSMLRTPPSGRSQC